MQSEHVPCVVPLVFVSLSLSEMSLFEILIFSTGVTGAAVPLNYKAGIFVRERRRCCFKLDKCITEES